MMWVVALEHLDKNFLLVFLHLHFFEVHLEDFLSVLSFSLDLVSLDAGK